MAPYFHHLLQSIVKLEYFKALNHVAMEQWSSLSSSFGEGLSFVSVQVTATFADTFSAIQLLFVALMKLDFPLLRVQLQRLIILAKLELWIALLFGWIVLSVTIQAYDLNTPLLEKNRENSSITTGQDDTNQVTNYHPSRPSPIDVHISSITTPYKSGFLQSKSNSNQAVLAPVNISNFATPPGKKATPPKTQLSPLTPDTGFNEILRRIEDHEQDNEIEADDADENEDDENFSEGYSINSGMSKSFSESKSVSNHSMTTSQTMTVSTNGRLHEFGPSRNMMHMEVLQLSIQNPAILIGWKIFVPAYGHGVILSMKRKKFHTTRFNIQFENYTNIIDLPLQRAKHKGKVPFSLVGKIK